MKNLVLALIALFSFSFNSNAQCDATFTNAYITCDSIWFVPVSTGPQYTYSWDFGDGGTSTSPSPAHQFGSDGTYPVFLIIQDTILGCTDILTIPVTINCGTPCSIFTAMTYFVDSTDCSVNFVSTATGGTPPYSYFWDFGDGSTSTSANPAHTYPNMSTWTPCVTITDASGCDTTICDVVYVSCAPTSCDAQFTSTNIACDSIWFVPASIGSQYSYSWDFGDGSTSNYANPAHQYSSDGTYTVVLTLSDTISGCTDFFTALVTVNCGTTPCTVDGATSTYVDSIDCSVNFISTAFGGTAPYTYYWQFGDGGTGTTANPIHTYPSMGTWTYCLTITDAAGCDTTICDIVVVSCAPSNCDATYTVSYIACDSIWFVPASTGPQYDYFWDFGDGATSTFSNPAHQYSSNGTYTTTLTIFDSLAGCSDIFTFLVTVNCGATPCTVVGDFGWNIDSTTCEVNFVATAWGGTAPYTFFWDFGDGNTSSSANPSHTYSGGPTFLPCLTITDASGCDTTICDVIIVDCTPAPCNADFTYTYIACDSVWFIPVSSGSQYDYFWDFGDGATSTASNPAHQYSADGTYLVYLILTDSTSGCSDILTIPVTINCGFTPCNVDGAFTWYQDSTTCEINFISTAFGGTAPYTYYWNFGDGNTSADAHPVHLYTGGPTFTPCLTISDANGCDTTICNVLVADCASVGIDDPVSIQTLSIYPNPGKDLFTIEAENINTIEIYDISGKLVWSETYQISTSKLELDLSNLEIGTYIVLVSDQKSVQTKKLIKL